LDTSATSVISVATMTAESKKERLIKSWKFSDEALAARFASNGVADSLLRLEAENFIIRPLIDCERGRHFPRLRCVLHFWQLRNCRGDTRTLGRRWCTSCGSTACTSLLMPLRLLSRINLGSSKQAMGIASFFMHQH
jgi:hypothetical protein